MPRIPVPNTSMVRLPGELAWKLSWLSRLSPEPQRIGDIVSRLIGSQVDDEFEHIRERAEQIEALEAGDHIELGEAGA